MPPANVGAALGSLRVLCKDPGRVTKLQENGKLFLDLANEAGLNTGMAQGTAIIPIITSDEDKGEAERKALKLAESLFENGINAQPIIYPAVGKEEPRIRIFMTAAHTEKQIRDSVEIIAREWRKIEPSANAGSNGSSNGAHKNGSSKAQSKAKETDAI